MQVEYTHEVPMGHRLQNHTGKCRYAHGHNYLVTVRLDGAIGADGMVVDFSELKRGVAAALDPYDHAFVLEAGDPLAGLLSAHARLRLLDWPPTAEVLATVWQADIARSLRVDLARVSVTVFETRNCGARI